MRLTSLSLSAGAVFAEPRTVGAGWILAPVPQGGEAELRLPDLGQAVFMNGVSGPTPLTIGLGGGPGIGFRDGHVHASAEAPGAFVFMLETRVDLRDLQDLLDYAGQVPLILRFSSGLSRSTSASCNRWQGLRSRLFGIQPGGYRRQLRRGVVRDSREHLCESRCLRQPAASRSVL